MGRQAFGLRRERPQGAGEGAAHQLRQRLAPPLVGGEVEAARGQAAQVGGGRGGGLALDGRQAPEEALFAVVGPAGPPQPDRGPLHLATRPLPQAVADLRRAHAGEAPHPAGQHGLDHRTAHATSR